MDESVDGESKDELKKLSKFVTLRDIKMDVKKGEFISMKFNFVTYFFYLSGVIFLPTTWEIEIVRSDVPPW